MASLIVTKRSKRFQTVTYEVYDPLNEGHIFVVASDGQYDSDQITFSKDKSWVRTPNYRALKAAHQSLPDNSFIYTEFDVPTSGSTYIGPAKPYRNDGVSWYRLIVKLTGPAGVGVYPPVSNVPDYNAVNAKLIASAKGNQWNVPIFIAEGRKTVTMVVNMATRVALMANALRRGHLGDFSKHAHQSAQFKLGWRPRKGSQYGINTGHEIQNDTFRHLQKRFGKDYALDPKGAFANYWLELRYGWLPFMADTRSAVNTLMDVASRPDSLEGSVKARVKGPSTTTTDNDVRIFGSSEGFEIFGSTEIIERTSYRATWRYKMKPEDIPGRFGLLNPLEVIWELVPLSFVVDWFSSIGSYLSALDVPLRFAHVGGTYGWKYESRFTTKAQRTVPLGGRFTGFSGTGTYTTLSRHPMTRIPELTLSSLALDPNLGLVRMTSALALLSQTFKRR